MRIRLRPVSIATLGFVVALTVLPIVLLSSQIRAQSQVVELVRECGGEIQLAPYVIGSRLLSRLLDRFGLCEAGSLKPITGLELNGCEIDDKRFFEILSLIEKSGNQLGWIGVENTSIKRESIIKALQYLRHGGDITFDPHEFDWATTPVSCISRE